MQAGNKRTLYWGEQTAEGTPQDTPTLALRVEDFTPNDPRPKTQLQETDRSSQDGASVPVAVTPGFTMKLYVRPSEFPLLAEGFQGSNADSGTTPDFTHTADPDDDQAWYSVFVEEPTISCDQFTDCRIGTLVVTGAAGGVLEVECQVEAKGVEYGVTPPVGPVPVDELPYVYPLVAVSMGGVHPGTVDAFTLTLTRNLNRVQGDNGWTSKAIVPGKYTATLQLTNYLDSDGKRRAADTGSTTGTVPDDTIFTEDIEILVARNATNSIKFTLLDMELLTAARPVKPDGTPLSEELGYHAKPHATFSETCSIVTKNQVATP